MLKRIEKPTAAEEAILAAAPRETRGEQSRAVDLLRERGLPTRKVEAWHYTDLRVRLKAFGSPLERADDAAAGEWLRQDVPLINAVRLPFINGRFAKDLADDLPQGVEMMPYRHVGGFRDGADAVALINTVLAGDGIDITVAGGATLEKAIEILSGTVSSGASAVRHAVVVGAGATATFVDRAESADDLSVQTSSVIDLTVGDEADVTWVIVQEEGDAATHLAQLNVTLGARAKLLFLVLNAGGALVRREINVTVAGEDSELMIRGVNLIGGSAHLDVNSVLLHEVPGAVSTEIFRNVATEKGAGAFQGQIRVAQIAQKTDARMACNTLLLSDEAEFSAKPELEIFADDVQCGHGATVSDILDDHLFYLMSRGIPERDARAMLIKAFVEEAFDEVGDEALREGLNAHIENWLERHG